MNLPNMLEAKKRNNNEFCIYDYEEVELDKSLVGKKYYVRTYGCQMNEHDGERVKGVLTESGMTEASDMNDADLIILNTCAIRENAHDKVFGFMGLIKKMKETKPDLLMGICGCMAQEESVVKEIMNKYKYVDFVFGTHNLNQMIKVINERIKTGKQNIEVFSKTGDVIENIPAKRDSKVSAWVDIILGCDKFCTYCIVPYTRGTQRSRRKESIIKEVEKLKNDGYKEVTLLGQNVNAYGKDLKDGVTFDKLLEEVAKTNIERVRFVTSHPWDFTDEMIRIIRDYKNVMPYVHLPVQSGSDKILKLMGRRYTKESYLDLALKIREMIPNVSLTTDIIVGFPGETEEDFNETLDVVEKCKYDSAFTFIYSPRENTPAAKMNDPIPLSVKQERLQRLNEIVNKYALINNEKLVGQVVPVLIEGESQKGNGLYAGYTDTMKLTNVKCDKEDIGKIINVKITEAKTWSLNGEKE